MAARTIWILSHARAGDLDQMLALARALGWPATIRKLSFRAPKLAAAPFMARLLFDKRRSDPIDPPWPDVVLCAEGRCSAIARLIRERSRGAVKTVCLGRPSGSPAGFDLVLTTPQYRLAAGPNIVELSLPVPPEIGPTGGDALMLEQLARPLTAVLVGGTSLPERLDGEAATRLAATAVEHAQGGTLLFVTSPRTGAEAAAALAAAVPAPHLVHLWRRGADNPYWSILQAADCVVVTSDSVSMVMDAFVAGKPVSVYPLPRHHTMRNRAVDWLAGRKHAAWLFDLGIIELRPDRRPLFERLVAQGRLHWFGEAASGQSLAPRFAEETALAVARVKQLFPDAKAK